MVREMSPEDVLEVGGIEQACFSDPWSLETIKEGMGNPFDTWLVLEEETAVKGYCVFRIIAGEGELFRIAILPQYRGGGRAKKLMERLAEYSRKNGVTSIFLEVRESNKIARNLYKSYGFEEEGIRKNYYQNPSENAVIMRNHLI
ncbi:MAG: ribosomal protein S18-alanine N-acetyltransferase [Lacrimispora sp.]|uniref:ribosomal protein S18-alanine N-acetyltransferase n=1 Tax=Lacrimispora sp. TaxID=2719234 RepID=UPI0039E612D9